MSYFWMVARKNGTIEEPWNIHSCPWEFRSRTGNIWFFSIDIDDNIGTKHPL